MGKVIFRFFPFLRRTKPKQDCCSLDIVSKENESDVEEKEKRQTENESDCSN